MTDSHVCGISPLINPIPGASYVRGFTAYHNGTDLAAPYGTAERAAQAGQVIWAGWDIGGLGWSVKINHCDGRSTVYGHMAEPPFVHARDNVAAGQQIGIEGMTGDATGPHLHFMVEINNAPVNPYCYDFQLPPGGSC